MCVCVCVSGSLKHVQRLLDKETVTTARQEEEEEEQAARRHRERIE